MDRRISCIFQNIEVKCTLGEPAFGCICRNHVRLIMAVDLIESKLVTSTGERRALTKLVATEAKTPLFPFPFTYQETKKNFCVHRETWRSAVPMYVQQLPIKNELNRKKILAILQTLMVNGYVQVNMAREVCVNVAEATEYFTQHFSAVLARTNNMTIAVVTEATKTTDILLSEFPRFYQLLFYYMEMSTCTKGDTVYTFHPTVQVSTHDKSITLRNNKPWETYIMKDDATEASALVLEGIHELTAAFPFSAPGPLKSEFIEIARMDEC